MNVFRSWRRDRYKRKLEYKLPDLYLCLTAGKTTCHWPHLKFGSMWLHCFYIYPLKVGDYTVLHLPIESGWLHCFTSTNWKWVITLFYIYRSKVGDYTVLHLPIERGWLHYFTSTNWKWVITPFYIYGLKVGDYTVFTYMG